MNNVLVAVSLSPFSTLLFIASDALLNLFIPFTRFGETCGNFHQEVGGGGGKAVAMMVTL